MTRLDRRHLLCAAAAAMALMGIASTGAQAEAFPSKPITMLVGYKAGGQTDLVGRAAAQVMSEKLGVPINVVNKPGAGGAVAALELSRAAPDGYTMLFQANSIVNVIPFLVARADFAPDSFEYAGFITAYQVGLAARKDAPFDDLPGFVAWARQNPGATYGSLSPASRMIIGEIAKKEGLDLNVVPMQGGGEVINAILGDQVSLAFSGGIHYRYPDQIKTITALTTFRHPSAPDAKTIDEEGYQLGIDTRAGLFFPKGTAPEILTQVSAALSAAAQDEAFKKITGQANVPIMFMNADEAKVEIAESYERNGTIFRNAGIEPK